VKLATNITLRRLQVEDCFDEPSYTADRQLRRGRLPRINAPTRPLLPIVSTVLLRTTPGHQWPPPVWSSTACVRSLPPSWCEQPLPSRPRRSSTYRRTAPQLPPITRCYRRPTSSTLWISSVDMATSTYNSVLQLRLTNLRNLKFENR